MGHVVNPVNFRLGTVKMWNSNIYTDFSMLKYNGYFAVVSYNIYFFLSKIFRGRFFTYVTSFIFSHIKLFWKFNKILCFIFLFNGATEVGGYKTNSLVSFFFSKQKKYFRRIKKNIFELSDNKKISIFPNRFFFETGFSYNFFYKMWINKKLRYYGMYKPTMIDQIKRDAYKFLFKTKVSPETSIFQRFLFKHMMYKRKELRKKWNKMNHKKIKINKNFRRFFIKKYLKYIYYISMKKPVIPYHIRSNKRIALSSLKYYRNIKSFKNFNLKYGSNVLEKLAELRYNSFFFPYGKRKFKIYAKSKKISKKKKKKKKTEEVFNFETIWKALRGEKNFVKKKKKKNTEEDNSKYKINKIVYRKKKPKFKIFPRKLSRSFKARNFLFQEPVYRSKRKRLKRRTYMIDLNNKFKFFLNKLIKKLKFNIYKVFFRKIINIVFFINNIYNKIKNANKKYQSITLFFLLALFQRKLKLNILFKKGVNNVNINKFKVDLIFSKVFSYNLDLALFKNNSWNIQKKFKKALEFIFKGFKFKIQFHFLNIKNVNAKIISNYIAIRLKQKYRIGPVIKEVKKYCNISKNIRGWKLTCAGRFSKKEIASYIVLKGGSFGYSSITSLLDYSFNSVVLKYSICGIKVWFVLKKNFKKIEAFKYKFIKIIRKQKTKKSRKKKERFFYKELKNSNLKKEILFKIKRFLLFFSYKNFKYKRLFRKYSGFWSIWRLFLKKYKFIF